MVRFVRFVFRRSWLSEKAGGQKLVVRRSW